MLRWAVLAKPVLRAIATAAILAPGAILLLMPLPDLAEIPWINRVLDFGHVPLFAVLTITLSLVWGGCWWWVGGALVVMAGSTELAQEFVGRSADVSDFDRSAMGVGVGIALLEGFGGWSGQPRRAAVSLLIATALVAYSATEVAPWVADAANALATYPVLEDFDRGKISNRWTLSGTTAQIIPDPHRPGHRLVRFALENDRSFGTATLRPPWPFLGEYRELWIEIDSDEPPPPHATLILYLNRTRRGAYPRLRFEQIGNSTTYRAKVDLEAAMRSSRTLRPEPIEGPPRLEHIGFTLARNPQWLGTIHIRRIWLK